MPVHDALHSLLVQNFSQNNLKYVRVLSNFISEKLRNFPPFYFYFFCHEQLKNHLDD